MENFYAIHYRQAVPDKISAHRDYDLPYALELPPWLFKTVTKLCRRFFGRGGEEAKGRLREFFLEVLLVLGKNSLPNELLIVAYTNSALLSTLLAILAS